MAPLSAAAGQQHPGYPYFWRVLVGTPPLCTAACHDAR